MANKTVNIKGVEAVLKNIRKVFGTVRNGKQLQKQMGNLLVTRIQLQARRGKPMRGEGKPDGGFPTLSEFTVIARHIYSIGGNTHPAANAKKSNVTLTGQLVDAVSFIPMKGGVRIFISPSNRSQYVLPPLDMVVSAAPKAQLGHYIGVWKFLRRSSDKNKSNKKVYLNLVKLSRNYKFLNINDKAVKSVNVLVKRFLRRAIRSHGF